MKVIVGLGNPGEKYQDTFHNSGFLALDYLSERLGIIKWKARYKGSFADGFYSGEKFILLKPQTFMNLSGESVLACKQFFDIDLENILIISDDIHLPAGKLRFRWSGGHGGTTV